MHREPQGAVVSADVRYIHLLSYLCNTGVHTTTKHKLRYTSTTLFFVCWLASLARTVKWYFTEIASIE